MTHPLFAESFFAKAESLLEEFRILFFLFRREKVFRYFFLLLVLVLISGSIFLLLEHDYILAAHPEMSTANAWEKVVLVFYWAIVTISTCGYGDFSPVTTGGRLLVILTLLASITTVAMFTANLASALTTKQLMERRGVMDLSNFRNHYILCGWKQAMDKMLDEILFNNPKINLNKILIIANVEPDDIEIFRQQFPAYQKIPILRGEPNNETLLRKANVTKAAQLFLLADESNPTASTTERDSKTVMTAMTIRTLTREAYICAELLDIKFENYLRSAHVDDIVYTSEYSKVLIANAFSQVGVAKVVNDLLNAHTPAFITTEKIPPAYLDKSFGELRQYYHNHGQAILIGLVENVGSYVERKQEAIREAQKTADINKLVVNLKNAKQLENNQPNINPEDTYPVPANALAVLVSKRNV